MNNLNRKILATTVFLLVSACATTDDDIGELQPYGTPDIDNTIYSDCFFARSVREWEPLDDRNLIVYASGRRPYHVRLTSPVFGLTSRPGIHFADDDGRICPFGGDAVVAGSGISSGIGDSARILSIKRLSNPELIYLKEQFGLLESVELPQREEKPERTITD